MVLPDDSDDPSVAEYRRPGHALPGGHVRVGVTLGRRDGYFQGTLTPVGQGIPAAHDVCRIAVLPSRITAQLPQRESHGAALDYRVALPDQAELSRNHLADTSWRDRQQRNINLRNL